MTAATDNVGGVVVLRLYVAGSGPNSTAARENLQVFLSSHGELGIELEVIDVLDDPLRGFRDGVIVTPTLVKYRPAPERRVIGRLRDPSVLLVGLGLAARP